MVNRTRYLIYAALVPAAIAVGIAGGQLFALPTTLRVGVGTAGGENLRLVEAINHVFAREHAGIRFKIIQVPGATDAAKLLDDGVVDLAVSRSDVAIPRQGDTVVILHADPVTILSTARAGLNRITDLRGHSVGVAGGLNANQIILKQLLAYYGIPLDEVRIVPAEMGDMPALIRDGKLDAVFLILPTASKSLRETFQIVSAEGGGPAIFIPVPEAEAIAERNATIDEQDVTQGSLSGNPIVPAETAKTITVSHRLFAQRGLAESTVAELARLLFVHKAAVVGENALASRIEKPETDNESTLAVHAGAASYYDGEVKTFMDRYGDWIYVGAMVLGFGGSGIAAVLSRQGVHQRRATLAMLNDLLALLERARNAESTEGLDDIEGETDGIFAATLNGATESRLEANDIAVFSFAFDHVRNAIEERRLALTTAGMRRLGRVG